MDLKTKVLLEAAMVIVWVVFLGVVLASKHLLHAAKPNELRRSAVVLMLVAFALWVCPLAADLWRLLMH